MSDFISSLWSKFPHIALKIFLKFLDVDSLSSSCHVNSSWRRGILQEVIPKMATEDRLQWDWCYNPCSYKDPVVVLDNVDSVRTIADEESGQILLVDTNESKVYIYDEESRDNLCGVINLTEDVCDSELNKPFGAAFTEDYYLLWTLDSDGLGTSTLLFYFYSRSDFQLALKQRFQIEPFQIWRTCRNSLRLLQFSHQSIYLLTPTLSLYKFDSESIKFTLSASLSDVIDSKVTFYVLGESYLVTFANYNCLKVYCIRDGIVPTYTMSSVVASEIHIRGNVLFINYLYKITCFDMDSNLIMAKFCDWLSTFRCKKGIDDMRWIRRVAAGTHIKCGCVVGAGEDTLTQKKVEKKSEEEQQMKKLMTLMDW